MGSDSLYSFEISNEMQKHNYSLPSSLYIHICHTSTQLQGIRYNAWDKTYEMWDGENNYWKFKVYYSHD